MKYFLSLNFLLLFMFGFASQIHCQDSLKFLNGKVISIKLQKVTDDEITYIEVYKAKSKQVSRETSSIFSYKEEGKVETILYEYNPEIGNYYSVEEMKDFMTGEQHADLYFKTPVLNVLSFAAGATSGYFLAQDELIFVAFPLVFSSVILIPGTKVREEPYNLKYASNESYISGFKRVANNKKFFRSLKFSSIGLIGSFAFFKLIEE